MFFAFRGEMYCKSRGLFQQGGSAMKTGWIGLDIPGRSAAKNPLKADSEFVAFAPPMAGAVQRIVRGLARRVRAAATPAFRRCAAKGTRKFK